MFLIDNNFSYVNIIDGDANAKSAGILVSDITDHPLISVNSTT